MTVPPGTRQGAPRWVAPEDFASRFADYRSRFDALLISWLEERRSRMASYAPEAAELVQALADLAGAGGKRLRPALVDHAYRACGGAEPEPVTSIALAVELLHTYLLVHDDIMDHAEARRGRPAAHFAFGELHRARRWHGAAQDYGAAVAILVGDLAHSYAVEIFCGAAAGVPRGEELRRIFFAMSEEVISGQHLELRVAARRAAGESELARVLRLKSGAYSVERPVQLGAVLAGAGGEVLERLSRYGAAVGEAFQLQDDILGIFGDRETLGKPVGTDLAEGKFTFLILHALRLAPPEQARMLERELGDPDLGERAIERIRGLMRDCGALDAVRGMVEERLRAARAALEGLDLLPQGRAFLEGLLEYLRERER